VKIRAMLLASLFPAMAWSFSPLVAEELKDNEGSEHLRLVKIEENSRSHDSNAAGRAILKELRVFQIPGFLLTARRLDRAQEELKSKIDESRAKLHATIVENPKPSHELDRLFTHYLNASAAQIATTVEQAKSLRGYISPKTMHLILDPIVDKSEKLDSENCIRDGALNDLSSDIQGKVGAIRKANNIAIRAAIEEKRTAEKQVIMALFMDQIPTDFEARIKVAVEKDKIFNQKQYVEIFQLRAVLTPDQMKKYFKRRLEIEAALEAEASENGTDLASQEENKGYAGSKSDSQKAVIEDIGARRLPLAMNKISTIKSEGEEAKSVLGKAQDQLDSMIVENPNPSHERELLFTRYLSASSVVDKHAYQIAMTLRDYIKPKTMQAALDDI
jgi:hypothetical protein